MEGGIDGHGALIQCSFASRKSQSLVCRFKFGSVLAFASPRSGLFLQSTGGGIHFGSVFGSHGVGARAKKKDTDRIKNLFSRILSELPQLFNPIELYHTTENKDTWKRAHIPKNIYRKRKGLTTHLDGVLILGKDSSPEYLIELRGIKKLS